jgi:hypothetical protein
MGRVILFGVLLLCAGCRTTPVTSFYQDIKFGMSPAEVRQVVYDHGGTVDEDAHVGDQRVFLAIMRGPDMLGQELTPFVTVSFQHDRMKELGVDYYFEPEEQRLFISTERCRQIFTQVVGDIVSAYGPPAIRNGGPDGKTPQARWKWLPDGKYLEAYASFGQERCGIVRVTAFDGAEAELDKFVKSLLAPKSPNPAP